MAMRASRLWQSPSSSRRQNTLRAGSLVEVRSNDQGLRGAWFEATTRSGLNKCRRYSITYRDLVSDEDSKSPLKETVHCSFVRPRPPPEDLNAAFELEQCVETFHNGGWWRGVVIKLPEGLDGLYTVYVPMTREELRFKKEEMRRQMEFVKGGWKPIEEVQEGRDMTFSEGKRVEVSRDRENFGAAWFVGTILKVIGKTNFLVEYEKLKVDSDQSTENPLKEIVDIQYLRPCPPMAEHTGFSVLDEVEGFDQDGWFTGVISEILPGSRYIVKYKHQEREVELDHTLLRPCHFWMNNQWVHSNQGQHRRKQTPGRTKSPVRQQKFTAKKRFTHPISSLTSGEDDEMVNAMSHGESGNLSILPPFRNTNDEIADASDAAKLKDNNPTVEMTTVLNSGWKTPARVGKCSTTGSIIIRKLPSSCLGKGTEHQPVEANFVCSPPSELEAADLVPTANKGNDNCAPSTTKMSRRRRKTVVTRTPNRQQKILDDVDISQNTQEMREHNGNISPNKITTMIESSSANDAFSLPNEQANMMGTPLVTPPIESSILNLQSLEYSGVQQPEFLNRGEEILNCDSRLADAGVNELHQTHPSVPSGSPSNKLGEMENAPIDSPPTGSLTLEEDHAYDEDDNPSMFLSWDAFVENEDRVPLNSSHRVSSLSGGDCLAGHSEHAPLGSVPERIGEVGSCINETGENGKEPVWPFTKKSELWKSIESLEVFSMLPQQPHFQPLLHQNETFREGMAIGLMATFATLVAEICSFSIVDSKNDFDLKFKALGLFESNGFNIESVRSRLLRLIEVHNMQSQLEGEKRSLKAKVLQVEEEMEKKYELLLAVDEDLLVRERELRRIQEKRESIILEIRKNESEIGDLEKGVKAAEEATNFAEQQFNAILTAPWR